MVYRGDEALGLCLSIYDLMITFAITRNFETLLLRQKFNLRKLDLYLSDWPTHVYLLLSLALTYFINYLAAYYISFFCGIIFSYIFNSVFVFNQKLSIGRFLVFRLSTLFKYAYHYFYFL